MTTESQDDAGPCTVPPGLCEMLEEFSAEVLRRRPENIYCFLADYCEAKCRGTTLPQREASGQNGHPMMQFEPASAPILTSLSPPALKQLEDQCQLLEKLRSEVCSSSESIHGQVGQGHQVTSGNCMRDRMNSVLAQAVELVKVLEQMQAITPQCYDTGSNPEGVMYWNEGQHQRSTQEICNEIHCLVKYMDQLSQEFDLALGNTNCPYHGGNWIPNCGGGGGYVDWNVAQGQIVPGFENGTEILPGFVYATHNPDLSYACADSWDDPCVAENTPLMQVGGMTPEPGFVFSECAPADQSGPALVNSAQKPQLSPSAAALAQIGLTAGTAALAHLSAGNSAQTLLPVVSESIANLFGADGESYGIDSTLRAITANLGAVWQLGEMTGAGQWATIIQDFLSNQLSIIQKLLTGEMSLKDAPYEVAFLTVSFLVGVIVGYKQLSGEGSSDGGIAASDFTPNQNVVFVDRAFSRQPTCL